MSKKMTETLNHYPNSEALSAMGAESLGTVRLLEIMRTISEAKDEIGHGNNAAALIRELGVNDSVQLKRITEISRWHYELAIEKLSEAMLALEQIRTKTTSVRVRQIAAENQSECRSLIIVTRRLLNRVQLSVTDSKSRIRKIIRLAPLNLAPQAALEVLA